MSKIQFFRNGAVAASLEAAKTAMSGATVLDGEMILGRYADGDKVRTLAAIAYVKDGVKSLEFVDNIEAVAGLQSQINAITGGGTGSIASQIATAIEALDAEITSADGQYVTVKVTEVDGKITAVNVTDAGVKTYADGVVKALADGAVATNAAAIAKLNGAADAEGSVAKAVADAKKELIGDAAEEYNTLGKLEDKIQDVEGAAKSYSIATVDAESLGENVREAYKLVDEDGTQAGATINIYKDSSLKSVALDNQELVFTYILADGTESVVRLDVSAFLHESEFGNGLQVVDHVISVKVDATSESFLTVGADGIKLAGVQDAIDAAEAQALADAKAYADGKVKELADGAVATNAAAIAKEVTDREGAVSAEAQARENADNVLSARIAAFETGDASVANQIAKAVAGLNATVGSQVVAEGKHVAVEVVETDGKLTGLTVTESDIASKIALDAEVSRADAAEKANAKAIADEITRATAAEAQALADAKSYADGLNTTMDTRVKVIEDDYLTSADKTELEGKITTEETRAKAAEKANADAIAVLNGDVKTAGSVLHTVHHATLDCGTY